MTTLSQAITQFIKPKEQKKLFLHNKGIAYIDYIPQQLRQAEILDLHRNQITKFHNLTMFTQLRNLNLGNNNIQDISEVCHLSKFWKTLEQLNLTGNRIVDRPLFFVAVTILLPNLKLLNGLPVNSTFRTQISKTLHIVENGVHRLLLNYLDLSVLHQIYKRDQINQEFTENFNVEKNTKNVELQLKQASSLLQQMSQDELHQIKTTLLHDIIVLLQDEKYIQLHNQIIRLTTEQAIDELETRQIEKIRELLFMVDAPQDQTVSSQQYQQQYGVKKTQTVLAAEDEIRRERLKRINYLYSMLKTQVPQPSQLTVTPSKQVTVSEKIKSQLAIELAKAAEVIVIIKVNLIR